jgi:phosphoglycolate phosphatase
MIRGVIFDKDGTLFDFRATWGGWTREVLRELAQDDRQAAAMAEALGYDPGAGAFRPDSPVIAHTPAEIATDLMPHLPGLSRGEIAARLNAMAERARVVPAVPLRPLLEGLRARGLRIGLGTNDAEAAAHAHLAAEGVGDLFDFVAGYDSGHGGKPAPGMCLAFARATGLAPQDCAMVGDSRHDLIAGRAAGMRCIAVLTGVAGAEDLAPHADAVLPDIGALPAWLDGRFAG